MKNSFFLCEMDEIYLNGLVMCKLHLGRHTHVILASYLPRTVSVLRRFQAEETKRGFEEDIK